MARVDLNGRGSRLWLLVPAAAGLLSAALGFLLVGRKSLSTDEGFDVWLSARPLADLLDVAVDSHVGKLLHLLVLHPIARVNDAEWAVRTPSVIAAAVAAALAYPLGARLFGRPAGAVAALALAVNAGVVGSAQLAQPYALALLGVVVSTLLFVLALERATAAITIAYVASAALLPLLHPAAASVVAAHLAAAIVCDRRVSAPVVGALAGVAVAVPVLVVAALDRADAPITAGVDVRDLAEGVARGVGWNPVLVGLAAFGVAAAAVRLRQSALWKAVLVAGLALAPLVAVLLSALALPVFPEWALVLSAPGLALGVGAAFAGLSDRQGLLAVGALTVVSAIAVGVQYASGPDEDWRSAARAVRLVTKADETVVVTPERARPVFEYYAPGIRTAQVARGSAGWVVVPADSPMAAIEAGRAVVPTPRYALRRQFRYGDGLRLQHWIRP